MRVSTLRQVPRDASSAPGEGFVEGHKVLGVAPVERPVLLLRMLHTTCVVRAAPETDNQLMITTTRDAKLGCDD